MYKTLVVLIRDPFNLCGFYRPKISHMTYLTSFSLPLKTQPKRAKGQRAAI